MKPACFPWLAALALAIIEPSARAGDAFFSPDGKSVTTTVVLPSSVSGLARIDIATGKAVQLPLPAPLREAWISGIARGADGEILFLASDAVWVMKEGEEARKVVSTEPVRGATGLFVGTIKGSPLMDWLFISGTEAEDGAAPAKVHARRPGDKKFAPIFCRRLEDADSGVYSSDGRLFFVSSGDLWEGAIREETDVEFRSGVLLGARIAPLAFLNTDEANGGNMWVGDVCPAGKWIYCSLRGRHMGAIVRTPLPAKALFAGEEFGFATVKDSYAAQSQAISRTEIISEDLDDIFGFCATEVNGRPLVFFYVRSGEEDKGPALMLWNGSGAPQVIGYLPRG